MLSNLSTGTRLYMKSPEGPRLEVITLTHGPAGPLFTVTPNTCRYPERREINLPHLLGFYNKHVAPESPYDGNPFKILFLLDGDRALLSLETVETERLKAAETVPCACCDPDYDKDLDNWSYDDDEEEDNGRADPDAMNAYMAAVAASSFKQQEAITSVKSVKSVKSVASLPPVHPEDTEEDEGVPRTYPQLLKRLRLLPRNLSVYVKLAGAPEWHGLFLRKGLFYDDGEGLNEWHLLGRYRKRFKVEGPSSTRGLQAIYVTAGVGANESLASLLLNRTDAELAVVGSAQVPVPVPQTPAQEPPAPGSIAAALARVEAKEQALLQELAELEKVQAAMARIAALEARVAEARQVLKCVM
jgi:hypothetical protein